MFNLETALKALEGHDEFVIKCHEGLVVLDYIVVFPGSFSASKEEIEKRAYFLWENSEDKSKPPEFFWYQAEKECNEFALMRRNFRGITFDEKTGKIISLPLHKFFNVNQTEESQFDLHKHRKAKIFEKMDGSMIHFFNHPDGRLLASTCRSHNTDQAKEALSLALKNPVLKNKILNSINSGWTPIFEFVAAHNQIVVQYKVPQIVYLVSRNMQTGEYKFDEEFPEKTSSFDFHFSEIFSHLDKTEFEGYVCHFDDEQGYCILKVKTPWYLERHRAVDALMRPAYYLYGVVFEGVMDDLIAMATENYKPILRKIYEEAQRDLLNAKIAIEKKFEDLNSKFNFEFKDSSSDKLIAFKKEVDALKVVSKLEAIKKVRDFSGLGLSESKDFVETGKWPYHFISQDESKAEILFKARRKTSFSELARSIYPEDFSFLMSLYSGEDPEEEIKKRLMLVYKEKYKDKIFANSDFDL